MKIWIQIRQALKAVFRRNREDQEMQEEMRLHRENQIEANLAAGMTRTEARRAANLQFGPIDAIEEAGRDARGFAWLTHLQQDLRYGLRMLLKHKGFTAVAVLTLGLGLSANITIFSVIDIFFFQPLEVRDPARLVVLTRQDPNNQFAGVVSWADYETYRDEVPGLEDATAGLLRPVHLAQPGQLPERTWVDNVSANFFSALGAKAHQGRLFLPGEGVTPGADPIMVLSHRYWRDRLGSDASVVGRTLSINGVAVEVIGVAAEGFNGSQWGIGPAGWLPASMVPAIYHWDPVVFTDRTWNSFRVTAYLAPGYDEARVRGELAVVDQRLRELHPGGDLDDVNSLVVREQRSRPDPAVSGFIPLAALVFLALTLMILLIACANVANLLFARAASRQRELGIRAAVGASRGRLTRQLLTESVLLAVLAGGAGWALSLVAGAGLENLSPSSDVPLASDAVQGSPLIMVFAVVVSLFAGVVTGLLPALRASRLNVQQVVKGGTAGVDGRKRQWLRNGLVISQVAFCAIVLIAGGLFLRSLNQAAQIPLGFDPANLVTTSIDLDLQGYERERGQAFLQNLKLDLEALPEVESVAYANVLPLGNQPSLREFYDTDAPVLDESGRREGQLQVAQNIVDPQFLATMEVPLLQGRGITEQDTADSRPVLLVNQELANRLWPDQDPIGRRISSWEFTGEVVGVVATGKYVMISEAPRPAVFLPHAQSYNQPVSLFLRTRVEPASVLPRVRQVLQRLDPELPVFNTQTMEEHLRSSPFGYMPLRMAAFMSGAQGLVGLLLAIMGVYGVVAYSVSQRTREIGIRLALGADRGDVFRLVVQGGLRLIGIGLVAGLLVSFGLSNVLSGLLVGLNPLDLPVFGTVTLLLVVVSFLACYLPARRAMRIDPAVTLKCE